MFDLMRRRICFLFIILSGLLSAQTRSLDSLLSIVDTMKEDTNKAKTITNILSTYIRSSRDPKKMEEFAWKELAVSQRLHYQKGIGYAYSHIGLCYEYKGNSDMAIYYHNKALQLRKRIKDKPGEASAYNNIANSMIAMGDYVTALTMHLKSLKIREELQDSNGIAMSNLNIGNIFSIQDKYDEALEYYFKAAKLAKGTNDVALGNAYNNIANMYSSKGNYMVSLSYHLKSLHIWEQANDKVGLVSTYNNMGNNFYKSGYFETALMYKIKAYDLSIQIGDKKNLAYACEGIANIYTDRNNYPEALNYYKKMLALATESNNKKLIQIAYDGFASLYKKMGNFKEAFAYKELYNNMKDSLLGLESRRQISELNTKYETEKRAKEILLLTKEKELNAQIIKQQQFVRWGLIAGLVVLLVMSIGIYRRYLFKQRANLELTKTQDELYKLIEQKEKLTSILAHDLKTPLRFMTTVSTYLTKNMDTLSKDRLTKLSAELNTSAKNTYAFADELLTWLSVQQQNFTVMLAEVNLEQLINEQVEFFHDIASIQHTEIATTCVSPVLIETDKRLLKIILRNIVDNAIKNTISGKIILSIEKQNNETIDLTIRDTGTGMSKEQLQQLDVENTYGFQFEIKNKLGFQIIKDLSTILYGQLHIRSEVGIGTSVTLRLPVKMKE